MKLGIIASSIAALSLVLYPQTVPAQTVDDSTSASILIAQGEGYAKSDRWQKAQDYFLKACSIDPSNLAALHDLAMSYAHMNMLAEAAECEQKALVLDENYVPSHIELAYVLGKLKDKNAARQHLKNALDLEPDNIIARKNLEALNIPRLQRQKNEAAAATALEPLAVARITETSVSKALVVRGINMYRQGKYDLARRLFEQALQNCPDASVARASLGVALGAAGDIDGEIREERRVLQSEPRNAVALANLAWALAQKGELKESLFSYQKALEYNPNLVDAQAGQGLILCRLGKWEAAVAVLKETVRLNPESPLVHVSLGTVLQSIGRIDEAISELKDSEKLAANSLEVKSRLAAAYLESEKFDKAAEMYKLLVERNQSNCEYRLGLGLSLTKVNDINGAYQQFKKAAELDKNLAAAHACLSMLEEMRGRLPQAESEARLAQEKDPDSTFFKESAERLARSIRINDDM